MQRRVSGFGKGRKIINLERKKSLRSQDNLTCLDYTNSAYDPTARNSLVPRKANTILTKAALSPKDKTPWCNTGNFHPTCKIRQATELTYIIILARKKKKKPTRK